MGADLCSLLGTVSGFWFDGTEPSRAEQGLARLWAELSLGQAEPSWTGLGQSCVKASLAGPGQAKPIRARAETSQAEPHRAELGLAPE